MLERSRDNFQPFWVHINGTPIPYTEEHRLAPWKIYDKYDNPKLSWESCRREEWIRIDCQYIEEAYGTVEYQRILDTGDVFIWTENFVMSLAADEAGEDLVAYPRSWIPNL